MMKKYLLYTKNSKVYSLGENGYQIKKVRVDIKKDPNLHKLLKKRKLSRKRKLWEFHDDQPSKKEEVTTPDFSSVDRTICYLCGEDMKEKSQSDVLLHYSLEHYRLELERNYIEKPGAEWTSNQSCPKCENKIEAKEEFIKHIGAEHQLVEQYMPEKYRFSSVSCSISNPEYMCPFIGCSSGRATKSSMLVHLMIEHYWTDMDTEFWESYKSSPEDKKCPICSMTLLDNHLGYIKHIAVQHEYVLKFIDRDKAIEEERKKNEEHKNKCAKIEVEDQENTAGKEMDIESAVNKETSSENKIEKEGSNDDNIQKSQVDEDNILGEKKIKTTIIGEQINKIAIVKDELNKDSMGRDNTNMDTVKKIIFKDDTGKENIDEGTAMEEKMDEDKILEQKVTENTILMKKLIKDEIGIKKTNDYSPLQEINKENNIQNRESSKMQVEEIKNNNKLSAKKNFKSSIEMIPKKLPISN